MRTTLNIDEDVLEIAKGLAESQRISLGEAVSYLARRGAQIRAPLKLRNGFYVFGVEPTPTSFGPDDVAEALDAEDRKTSTSFWKRT